ncbi:MAG: PH domain-containing protein, partial [Schleiferiaceae bacterium]|nr:PH domain-containing protein [Schleiferiaceae bacterium]
MKNINFYEPNRQNALGIIIMWFRNIWKSVNIFLPLIVVFASSARAKSLLMAVGIAGGIILVLLLLLVFSYFQYQRFFFYVEDDQFILEKGVFSRKKLTIPFERIQSVHL